MSGAAARIVPAEPPMGSFLLGLIQAGRCTDAALLDPPAELQRTPFFASEPPDPATAGFANLFVDAAFRSYRTSGVHRATLPDAVLLGTDGVVLAEDGAVVRDTLFHLMYWAPHSLVAEYRQAEYLRLKQPVTPSRRIDGVDVLVGFTGSCRNFSHWMQECLPKLVVFRALRQQGAQIRLLLPHFPRDSFQQQTLDLLGIADADRLLVGEGEVVTLSRAVLVSGIDLWSVPRFTRMAARILAECTPQPPASARPPRVYVHRARGARRVANFSELQGRLLRHGFMIAMFDDMPLAQQIVTMQGARHVIGEHGAGLANIQFSEDAALLEMFNPACVQPAFWSLASACGNRFGYLIGRHAATEDAPAPSWNTDYTVTPAQLDHAIERLLASAALA